MSLSILRRRPDAGSFDWAWGGLGVTMATASATFAAYMIATAPAEVTGFGSKDFGIFAQFDHRPRAVGAFAAAHPPPASGADAPPPALAAAAPADRPPPPSPAAQPAAPVATAAAEPAIDPSPTGSIPFSSQAVRVPPSAGLLPGYRVREVVGDHALIEHRSRLSLVRQGQILAGAGEVLAIERQGSSWVVRTAGGVIGGS